MDEKILLKFNSTRIAFLKWYLAAAVLVAGWAILFFEFIKLGPLEIIRNYLFVLPLAGIAFIIFSEIGIRYSRFYISEQRIVEKKGILSIEETYLQTDRVANYTIKQNAIERLLDIGTIEIESVDGDDEVEILMKSVGGISKIKELLDSRISATKYGGRGK